MVLFLFCFLISFGCGAMDEPLSKIYTQSVFFGCVCFEVYSPNSLSFDFTSDKESIEELRPIDFAKDLYKRGFDICWLTAKQVLCFAPEYQLRFQLSEHLAPCFDECEFGASDTWFFKELLFAFAKDECVLSSWKSYPRLTINFFRKLRCSVAEFYTFFFMFLWGKSGESRADSILERQKSLLKLETGESSTMLLAALGEIGPLAHMIHLACPVGDDPYYSSESMSSDSDSD